MELKTKLQRIKLHYELAHEQIKSGLLKEAASTIYDKLGSKLYDMSLDLEFNSNIGSNDLDEEIKPLIAYLKKLIPKVDKLINQKIGYIEADDLGESKAAIVPNSKDEEWFNEEF